MSRRDLSFIAHGVKLNYDTPPHTRALLANLRDFAVTEEELDNVARIADRFDAEDEAWNEARKVVQRAQGTEPPDQFYVFNFANLVGYTSMAAFEADLKKGIIPPHDGIDGNGYPYWRRATIEKFKGGVR